MATAAQYLAELGSLIGIREDPPGSNRTPIGVEYGMNGVAWCAETQSVVAARVGMSWLRTAWVQQIELWAKAGYHGMTWIPAPAVPEPGDLVVFDLKGHANPANFHVGAVVAAHLDGRGFDTIEGNWGDAVVYLSRRGYATVRGFARLPFDPPAAVPAPVPLPAPRALTMKELTMFALRNVDGRAEVFVLGDDGKVRSAWQSDKGKPLGEFTVLAGQDFSASRFFAGRDETSGSLYVWAVVAPFGAVMATHQATPGGGWVPWYPLNDLLRYVGAAS
jgi:hypothetical protein